MNIEQQVTSLELSKRLKELGVEQESLFWWFETDRCVKRAFVIDGKYWTLGDSSEAMNYGLDRSNSTAIGYGVDMCSAFTVAELGALLPAGIQCNKAGLLSNDPERKQWSWHCWQADKNHSEDADTEADARAKMLIHLIENKLI